MTKYFNKISLVIFLGSCFLTGLVYSTRMSIDSELIDRDPAAAYSQQDESEFTSSAFLQAAKERLLKEFRVSINDEKVLITVGHFVFKSKTGEKILACDAFPKIRVSFLSEDSAVNGEKSRIKIVGNCEIEQGIGVTDPLVFLWEQLYQETPVDGEYSYQDSRGVEIHVFNMSDAWPRKLSVETIELEGLSGKIVVNKDDIKKILGYIPELNF